ncbi:hypothetical protein Godav_002006 [Gossypium davidsonii]|uniref:Myb-like domain-containing protein n=1 Tax=Gossypium davidsonii TaxID=34287 RepID=A0A7J8T5E2_GOSDV|nr:hypothetical protein [Gossypium davidsonii]
MCEKDGHKSENKQTEDGNFAEKEIDDLVGVSESNAVEEIPMETCLGGKGNAEQESSKKMILVNNGEATRVRKDKHKKKNRDRIDAVATVTETEKICSPKALIRWCMEKKHMRRGRRRRRNKSWRSPDGTNKVVHGKEEAYEKPKVDGNVADDIAVTSSTDDKKGTGKENSAGNELECKKLRDIGGNAEDGNERKKKKSKSVENDSKDGHHNGDARTPTVENAATLEEKYKNVSFVDQVKVFPSTDVADEAKKDRKEGLVYGKRYSKEEGEIVMNAVAEYIESRNLGDEGLDMVLNCGSHKEASRKRRLRNVNKGRWSQDEYQSLFDLVNMDLSMKVTEEKKSKHGMLRDNICWTAISGKMLHRNFTSCEGVWVDVDAFSSLDTCCIDKSTGTIFSNTGLEIYVENGGAKWFNI